MSIHTTTHSTTYSLNLQRRSWKRRDRPGRDIVSIGAPESNNALHSAGPPASPVPAGPVLGGGTPVVVSWTSTTERITSMMG